MHLRMPRTIGAAQATADMRIRVTWGLRMLGCEEKAYLGVGSFWYSISSMLRRLGGASGEHS